MYLLSKDKLLTRLFYASTAIIAIFFGAYFLFNEPHMTDRSGLTSTKDAYLEWLESKLENTGGIPGKLGICPASAYDTLVPVSALDQSDLLMTIDGLWELIKEKNIKSIDDLITNFPSYYQNNFSLVEHTKATGQSSLEFPRIILFGPDGRFLINLGTKPDDPQYNMLDVAELRENGHWEFSVFDFRGNNPLLIRNDSNCVQCHGGINSRPIWGTNLEWPGVFGDNIANGPQGEALDARHAEKMNALMRGESNSNRFKILKWTDHPLKRGAKRRIAHHAFGAELILSNIAMGTATARGAYIRLKNFEPEIYRKNRGLLLLGYYYKRLNDPNYQYLYADQIILNPINKLGKNNEKLDLKILLKELGLDINEAFSLATLATKESPNPNWSMGEGDLLDMLMLQVLNEYRFENKELNQKLIELTDIKGVIDCPDTVNNMANLIDFKMLHLFYLRGSEKYKVNWVYYPLDAEDIYERVFHPAVDIIIDHIIKSNEIF